MKNWKTTSAGILMIAGGIVRFIFAMKSGNFSEEAIMTTVSSVLTGIGFLVSKDQNVTGGTVQQ